MADLDNSTDRHSLESQIHDAQQSTTFSWRTRNAESAREEHREQQVRQTRTEACVDLFHNHALDRMTALLQSFNEGFVHVSFDRQITETILIDEYDNQLFHVEYHLRDDDRDQVRIRWSDCLGSRDRNDAELLALARQIADLLGGGTNLRLREIAVE